jgi:hypothetical protein
MFTDIFTYEEAFKSHKDKTDRALQFLGKRYDKVFDEGIVEEGLIERGLVLEDTFVRHETRLDCAFIDYYANKYLNGMTNAQM